MDPVSLSLGVLQVVVPVLIAALPPVWVQIVRVLKRIPTMTKDRSQSADLVCIMTILDTLEHVGPDLYTMLSHNQALLTKIKVKAEALEKALSRKIFRLPKDKIGRDISDITLMMQLLDTNIRTRQGHEKSKEYNANGQVEVYQKRKQNLSKDLLTKLDEDDLTPVIVKTSKDFWTSMKTSGTYPGISYQFDHNPDAHYPKTLTVSRGVRECIEVLLKWLRDLKDINEGRDSSLVVGVAFYELFTEVLPQALMKHLTHLCRINRNIQNAKQFHANLCFLRAFLKTDTFVKIQGEDGLKLEEDDKVKFDLQHASWETWEVVQKKSESYISQLQEKINPFLVESGDPTILPSNTSDFFQCPICQVSLRVNSATRVLCENHLRFCPMRNQIPESSHTNTIICPICGLVMDHLSMNDREQHTNDCVDR